MTETMAEIAFLRDFAFEYGVAETLSPLIRRVVARNPSPFTFKGTGTYIVGRGSVAVIDPGPALPDHIEALLASLTGETVSHILVTHTHLDHSPAAAALKRATGAPTLGFGPHGATRSEGAGSEEGADRAFVPDLTLRDGDVVEGKGWRMEAVHTPGHTSNHLCFALAEERVLFSGDHVMGWSTSVIAPPDGDMASYLRALDKLLSRDDAVYWPTHGPAITDPKAHVRAFIAHRRERSAAILRRLAAGDETIPALVESIYVGLDTRLQAAAGRSVLSHLIALIAEGEVGCEGPPSVGAHFHLRRRR
ncbi:MAG TPA: MBL fold metallo-hydrolase [Stellaceae bacterium]|nr:MBL fold metallo-hydrolase [Stellaceae bacterium]